MSDARDRAQQWIESWPGPLKLVGGSKGQQSVPDAHNAAPDLIRDLLSDLEFAETEHRMIQAIDDLIDGEHTLGEESVNFIRRVLANDFANAYRPV